MGVSAQLQHVTEVRMQSQQSFLKTNANKNKNRITSMLELYLGRAFLALHFDRLAQLLLVFTLDIGILSVCVSFLVVWLSDERPTKNGLTGLRSARIRSCAHQCFSSPSAAVSYGFSSSPFGTECNRVRKKILITHK